MPRCLVMVERDVSQSERTGYLQSLAVRRESAAAASAHFWVFADAKSPGHFLEFVEAGSKEALALAIEAVGQWTSHEQSDSEQVVWSEVPESPI